MVQFKVFAICLASVFVLNFVNCADFEMNVESTSVQNITQFLIANPEFKLIQNLAQVKNPQVKDQKYFRFGSRVYGDKVVGQAQAEKQFTTATNVRLTLTYPRAGEGATISYVEVRTEQSSNQGRGYIIAGGIGQKTIRIIIELQETLYFRLSFVVYGY